MFRPRLWGQPVVVLSNNDGCVIARSPEAKTCGIPMGAPAHLWRQHFREHHVEVFSSNYALYGDMSRRVMTLPDEEKQTSLFKANDPAQTEKERRLMAAVDALNLHYGRGTVRPATAGFRQSWAMRQARKSPCYTTRLADVPHARLN